MDNNSGYWVHYQTFLNDNYLAIAKKQKSAVNVLLFAPTLDNILESELTNKPEIIKKNYKVR